MEQITFEATARELVHQLEYTLAKLAVAADAKIPTGNLETKAQKLATKIKASAELFNGLSLFKDVKGSEIYNWNFDTRDAKKQAWAKHQSAFRDCSIGMLSATIDNGDNNE